MDLSILEGVVFYEHRRTAHHARRERRVEFNELLASPLEYGRAAAVSKHRHPKKVRADARAWRTKERAANLAPLSTKVRHKGGKVEVAPQPKKRGGK